MAFPTLMALAEIPGLGLFATDARTVLGKQPLVTPKHVSRTKMSSELQAGKLSSGVRFVAIDAKDTKRPSALIETPPWFPGLPQFAREPSLARDTRLVLGVQAVATAVHRSRTYTFACP
jgi:hypothetical protein